MEKFNIKRFWQTFKWLFCENSIRLLVWAVALTLAFFMIESFLMWSTQQLPQDDNLTQHGVDIETVTILGSIGFCFFIALIAIHFGYSRVFAFLKTKQKRIAYLTLPATNTERFVAALLFILIVFPCCVMLALALGDTLRMLTFGLTGGGWQSGIPAMYKDGMLFIPDISSWHKFAQWMWSSSIMLWVCSLYILGGTWFRQHGFIIVTAALIVFFIVVAMCFPSSFDSSKHIIHHSPAVYPLTFVLLAAALFNIWLSYKIFTRFQIITSKWTNV